LSVVDRRTTKSKELAVSMVEESLMGWSSARTSSAANNQGTNSKNDIEEEGEDDDEGN